ncbi:MAG TPA: hypothetical protein VFR04_04160 [Solirubrobacterales bacterium]|nr:hypothetical protein [Solirubrobacterales bacterium]
MPNRARLLKLVPLTLIFLVFATGSLASARYVRPAAVPDGRYGKVQGDELIGFKVEDRKVTDFFFNMRMQCHNSETGEDYDRYFSGSEISGGRANFNGKWSREYAQTDGGRNGSGLAEVNFSRTRGVLASISVVAPAPFESFEDCFGFLALKVRRGPLGPAS